MEPSKKMSEKPKKDDFVHLHTHSDFSTLDGAGKISAYVAKALERGNPAIGFTDHGTMRGYMQSYEECKGEPIKPIYGSEFYISRDMRRKGLTEDEKGEITKGLKKHDFKQAIKSYEENEGIRDRWHITVWAYTQEGLRNLYRLSSASFIEGFYYKPRIDLAELIKYGDGLLVSTGCLSSPINDSWLIGKRRYALDFADQLYAAFGDRMYLEIQPHAIREQVTANELMLKLRDRYPGIKMVATQDAHYVDQPDSEHHEVLLCIGTNTNMSDPTRFKFDGDEFHMRTRKQMREAFARHHSGIPSQFVKEALNTTLEIADRIETKLEVDYFAAKLPPPPIPMKYGEDSYAYMRDLCLDGWKWRNVELRAERYAKAKGISHVAAFQMYRDRLKHEMKALRKQHFVPYFLIVHDIYHHCRATGIMTGPGRGSVGGSLIAYLIGITAVDPIEHGLIFERFINPFRIDMPDIDMDFEDRRRGEVMDYLVGKYGRDRVAQIATVGKLSGKACLRDVSRVLEVPLAEVNAVTKAIIERSSGDERASQTIVDSFKDFEVCRAFDKKYPKVLYHAKHLEGLSKTLGIHAAGVVTSPVPLTDLIPLEIRKHDGKDVIVTALDMYGAAAVGLVKLDVLGLRTLTVLKECIEEVHAHHGVEIDLEGDEFDLNDPKTLQGFTDHDYGGIFQYDTPSADKVCMGVKFTSFEDIAAMTALNRPGTARSGLATKYVERKKNPKLVSKIDFHPKVSEITADTLGIIVYQEHVIRIFTDIAGFAPGTADSLRKTIAKKVGDETMGKEREAFVAGAMKTTPGMTEAVANKIMDAITFFGSYGFNKSHATAYGMIAYWGMWLKTYYPLEFYWALLKNEPDRIRIAQLAKGAKKKGILLLPPHVNVSTTNFTIDREKYAIRGSLVDIKGVGQAATEAIVAGQPYKDFTDYMERIDRRKAHKGVNLSLAKAGAFDGMIPSVRWFIEGVESGGLWKTICGFKKATFRPKMEALLEAGKEVAEYPDEDRVLLSSSVNPLAFGKHPIDAYGDFMKRRIAAEIADMGDEDFFKNNNNKGCYIAGIIVEVRYNQIGDFHTGAMPSEEEKKRMFWGERYANVNIECASGKQNRTKFDIGIFERERPLIDSGIGTPVIAHVTANATFENLASHFAVDLAALRKKLTAKLPTTVFEDIVMGRHPAKSYPWKDEETAKNRAYNVKFKANKAGGIFVGVVTHVRLKYDKNGNVMAFFGLIGADDSYIDVIAFSSVWEYVRKVVQDGRLLMAEVEKKPDRVFGLSHFCGNRVKWLKKSTTTSA
jgi:DNA polymerase-3 subunit alpha